MGMVDWEDLGRGLGSICSVWGEEDCVRAGGGGEEVDGGSSGVERLGLRLGGWSRGGRRRRGGGSGGQRRIGVVLVVVPRHVS